LSDVNRIVVELRCRNLLEVEGIPLLLRLFEDGDDSFADNWVMSHVLIRSRSIHVHDIDIQSAEVLR
jgi:hypothetical protein